MEERVLAVDLGASSGRVMAGSIQDGKLVYEEMHRFKNSPKRVNGSLKWDIEDLFSNIKLGIKKSAQKYKILSIGIDTWGVDFGMIDKDGNLITQPYHYRDEGTEGVPEEVYKVVSAKEIYERTGIQMMRFNTIYQLYKLKIKTPELWEKTEKILLVPDLIAYMLTGVMRTERTEASTTNLLSVKDGKIDLELMGKLGLKNVFSPMIEPGETYGPLLDDIAAETGAGKVNVVAVCSHDTASAVASVPCTDKDIAYISSGTWSLLGTELDKPNASSKAHENDFTNEIGVNKTVRFLKNIMGLWILQQTKATYEEQGKNIGFGEMEQMALSSPSYNCFIDVDDKLFELPGDMLTRVNEYLEKTGQKLLDTDGEKIRCIYESLALKYALMLNGLKELTDKNFSALHIFGGGIQAKLLCKMSASACNVRVICGPVEATASGNIALQMIALGKIKDITQAREMLKLSPDIYTVDPENTDEWKTKYNIYKKIVKGE